MWMQSPAIISSSSFLLCLANSGLWTSRFSSILAKALMSLILYDPIVIHLSSQTASLPCKIFFSYSYSSTSFLKSQSYNHRSAYLVNITSDDPARDHFYIDATFYCSHYISPYYFTRQKTTAQN